MKILVLEDDQTLLESIIRGLHVFHHEVYGVMSLKEMDTVKIDDYEAVILDLSLPDGDSLALCQRIRRENDLPIIFLSANNIDDAIIAGLNAGGDDYLTKPVSLAVLNAKLTSLSRRFYNKDKIGDLCIDYENYHVLKDGKKLELTHIEYSIIFALISKKGHLLTREQLFDVIYNATGNYVESNTISVYMKRLRNKLGSYHSCDYIETVRGIGYRLYDGK